MRTGIQGLRPTPIEQTHVGDDPLCYVTAATYPLDIPYYNGDNPLQGRIARMTSILLTSIVNRRSCSYDSTTHTIILDREFIHLCKLVGIYNGGNGVRRIRETLEAYPTLEFLDEHGDTVKPFTRIKLATRGVQGTVIEFTPEYERLMTTDTRTIHASTLLNIRKNGVATDMLMLAVFYAPDDRRLFIGINDLRALLPTSEDRLLGRQVIARYAVALNETQTEWRFTVEGKALRIQPAGVYVNDRDDVALTGIR